MYGRLFFDEQRGVLGARVYFGMAIPPAPLDPAQSAQRQQVATQMLDGSCPDAQERQRIAATMAELSKLMDATDLVFGLHMAMAHHLLPEAQRSEREATIAQLIEAHLPAVHTLPPPLSTSVDLLRRTAITAPDPLMEMLVRTQCGRLCSYFTTQPQAPLPYQTIGKAAGGLMQFLGFLGQPVVMFVIQCWTLRPVAEGDRFIDLIAAVVKAGKGAALETARGLCEKRFGNMSPTASDLLVEVMQDLLARPTTDPTDIVTEHLERLGRQDAVLRDQVVRDSTAAVRQGVPMGAPCTADAQAALARVAALQDEADQRMTQARLRACPALSSAEPNPAANQDRPDLDPAYTWSIDRLLLWIEGSLTRQSAPRRVDRKRIVAQETEAVKQRAKVLPPKGRPAPPKQAPLTEEDVNAIILHGLAATAQFFLDDITELVPLAQRLGAPAPAVQACSELLGPLRDLVQQPGKHEETEARATLGRAEDAVTQLRRNVRAGQADAALKSRFNRRLIEALRAEPLVRGKRHGGVIGCPMRLDNWPWVVEQFHNRWLAGAHRLVVDGVSVTLRDNEALALYVTAGSQSRYAFDVTVHLWRRRPGTTGRPCLPGRLSEGFPPMNTADWDDSYTTCCVLHVPAG